MQTGSTVAKVDVQFSGTQKTGQAVDTTFLASKVAQSTETALSLITFSKLVNPLTLKNIKPVVVLATTTTRRVNICHLI